MAYLENYPVVYRDAEGRRAIAHFTTEAADLEGTGWFLEEAAEPEPLGLPEPEPEPAETAPELEVEDEVLEPEVEEDVVGTGEVEPEQPKEAAKAFEFMTRPELLEWAMERGVDLPNRLSKAELVAQCEKIARG